MEAVGREFSLRLIEKDRKGDLRVRRFSSCELALLKLNPNFRSGSPAAVWWGMVSFTWTASSNHHVSAEGTAPAPDCSSEAGKRGDVLAG